MASYTDPFLESVSIRFARHEATLCRRDGTEFAGGTVVTKLKPAATRSIPTIVEYADNSKGWVEVGKKRRSINSMVVNCFRWEAATQIMQAVANERTGGLFMLVVPPRAHVNERTRRYIVRFFAADFEPQTRRGFRAQLFSATISDIEILGSS